MPLSPFCWYMLSTLRYPPPPPPPQSSWAFAVPNACITIRSLIIFKCNAKIRFWISVKQKKFFQNFLIREHSSFQCFDNLQCGSACHVYIVCCYANIMAPWLRCKGHVYLKPVTVTDIDNNTNGTDIVVLVRMKLLNVLSYLYSERIIKSNTHTPYKNGKPKKQK